MGRKRKGRPVSGWLLVDKPKGVTSTDVVNKVRRHLEAAKAGHGGTLDPLATGLLPVAFGEATKLVSYALHGEKTYRFTIRWGIATESQDAEGAVTGESPVRPSEEGIRAELPRFQGVISQVPPRFSAIRVDGARAYDLARAGEEVELAPREVEIHRFDLVARPDADHAEFEVDCGPGTYIRALARDLAEALGTLGHVSELRRTEVSGMNIRNAIPLEDFLALGQGAAEAKLLAVEQALDDIPALELTADEARRLRLGQSLAFIRRPDRERLAALGLDRADEDLTAITVNDGKAVALVTVSGPEVRVLRVLNL
jgi:tRNA pseudouridine55 synthase